MTRCCISFTLVVFCVLVGNGCRLSAERRLGDDLVEPSLREQLGVSPDSQADTRVGYLSNMAMQHPSISERDDYLDLYDKEGNWINQIVIVFAEGVAPPLTGLGLLKSRVLLGTLIWVAQKERSVSTPTMLSLLSRGDTCHRSKRQERRLSNQRIECICTYRAKHSF